MSLYLNPGSEGFEEVLRTEYVDKTGLIGLTNRTLRQVFCSPDAQCVLRQVL